MCKSAAIVIAVLSTVLFCSASVADPIRGGIALLKACPGDTTKRADESAILALLTPLLTGIVNRGLKTAGEKLSEAAKEANIDVVHKGDHFYAWNEEKENFELQYRCLIVWSKGVKETGRRLGDFVAGYQAAEFSVDPDTGELKPVFSSAPQHLQSELKKFGMEEDKLPGLLGVFDVELSEQRTEARLVPRFVTMDHSVREGKTDTKSRTMTFEFAFGVPGADKPFAAPSVKLDNLVVGIPFVQTEKTLSRQTSTWFSFPELAASVGTARNAHKEATGKSAAELTTARLAGHIASSRGDKTIAGYLNGNPFCPATEIALQKWVDENVLLRAEKDKKADQDPPPDVPRYENSTLFYKSCLSYLQQEEILQRLHRNGVTDRQIAGPFDATVTMKEFRKRPFAEFFGAVLSEDTTRTALTSAIAGQIDPATRAADEKKEQEAVVKAREAYEAAYIAAETAIATYDSTKDEDPTKAAKFIDMEAKKRAANRRAQDLEVALPYPEAGLWIG